MPNPTIKLKDFVQSYTFKVAYDLQRPLFGLTELPADCLKSTSKGTQCTLLLKD